jgi:hypothetical protein
LSEFTVFYSYIETSGGQSSNLYLNFVLIRHLWQLKTIVFLHWHLIRAFLLNDSFFQAEKKGLVMVNFFSYFLTCTNHSTINDVIGKKKIGAITFGQMTIDVMTLDIMTLGLMTIYIMTLGPMTLGMMTLGPMTLDLMPLGLMTLGLMTLGLMTLGLMTLGLMTFGLMAFGHMTLGLLDLA